MKADVARELQDNSQELGDVDDAKDDMMESTLSNRRLESTLSEEFALTALTGPAMARWDFLNCFFSKEVSYTTKVSKLRT